jgi:hypothetical protein
MNSEAVQKPVADEGAPTIPMAASPTRPKPLPRTTLPASHPAMSPTTKMTSNPWSDKCMLFLQPFDLIRAVSSIAKNSG